MRKWAILGLLACGGCGAQSRPSNASERATARHGWSLRVVPLGDLRYRLDVVVRGRAAQEIVIRNGIDPTGSVALFEQDGYDFLVVLGGRADRGEWFKVWCADPSERELTFSHVTEPGSHDARPCTRAQPTPDVLIPP